MTSQAITMHGDVAVIGCRGRIVAGELEKLRDAARSVINDIRSAINNTPKVIAPIHDSIRLAR